MKAEAKAMYSGMEKTVAEMKHAVEMAKGCLTSTPFVVRVGSVCIDPDVVDKKTVVGPTKTGLPHKVARFSRRDAELIATSVKNGNGVFGEAVSWREATVDMIANFESSIKFLKERNEAEATA